MEKNDASGRPQSAPDARSQWNSPKSGLGEEPLYEDASSEPHRLTAAAAERKARVQSYSFFRAGQVIDEQMHAIGLLNDVFARNLTHNLGIFLRAKFEVELVRAEQMPFNEWTARLPEVAYVSSVRLEPLRATSVLQMDLRLAPPMVDLLLGGEGKPGVARELTEIEESILTGIVEIVCRELTLAWQPVGLSFVFEKRQIQTQVAHLLPLGEKTLCLSFEIRMPHARGTLNLAFPAVVSRTILRRLTGERNRVRRHSPQTRQRMRRRAESLRFGSTLQLPPVRIPLRELEALTPGKLILLPIPANTSPELSVAGKPLFAAQVIRHGEYRSAHLADPSPAAGESA